MNISLAAGAAHASEGLLGRPQNPRLVAAAHEFEASMLAELLKPMEQNGAITDKESDQGSEGALMSYSTQALGKAISEHGGIGIARQVLAHLRPESAL
jgi:flagellar protein FlgJ